MFGVEDSPNAKLYFRVAGVSIAIFVLRYVASIAFVLMYM